MRSESLDKSPLGRTSDSYILSSKILDFEAKISLDPTQPILHSNNFEYLLLKYFAIFRLLKAGSILNMTSKTNTESRNHKEQIKIYDF